MFKKFICAAAAACLLASLSACAESSSTEPTPASSPAAQAESSAPAAEESAGSNFSVTFTTKNGVVYDVADCNLSALQPGNVVKGEIKECQGPVANFQQGSYVMYNKMTFFALYINDKYVLYGAPNAAGTSASLSLLAQQVADFYEKYREDMTEEELAKIRPWTTAQINGRVEVMPQELKDVFKAWGGEAFEAQCETTHYLVDEDYHE